MKRQMSWLDLSVWVSENGGMLVGGVIDNIYGDSKNIVLRIRGSGEPILLVIRPGEAVYITARHVPRDRGEPPPIIMGFRKYLRDSRIESVEQKPCERILIMRISRGGEEYSLIAELIPRGIVSVADGKGIVKMLTGVMRGRDRLVRIGSKYQYPPPQPGICGEPEAPGYLDRIMKGYDIVRGLVIGLNMPPDAAEEILYRVGIDKGRKPSELGREAIERIIEAARIFIKETVENPDPGVIMGPQGHPEGYYPYEPRGLIASGYLFKRTESFNEAIDLYYASHPQEIPGEKAKEVARIEKSIEKLRKQVEEASKDLEGLRSILDYINNNYQAIEEILECVRRTPKSCGGDGVVSIRGDRVEVILGGARYALDPRLSMLDNYISLRKRISELERRIERGREEISRLEEEARRIYEELERRRAVEMIRSMRRMEWFERYHWLITSEGLLAIGGMDADQNDKIVRRYLKDNYIFLHADIHGGSAVILITDREYTHRSIEEAARLAACYSRAWTAGYGSIDVFYVKGSQVSKTPPPGQYLEKGSFMIYGEKSWIKNVPLELAIGIEVLENNTPRIVVGDQGLVSKRARIWSLIAPGETPRREVAEKIYRKWIDSNRIEREIVEAIEIEEIIRRIPGASRIIK